MPCKPIFPLTFSWTVRDIPTTISISNSQNHEEITGHWPLAKFNFKFPRFEFPFIAIRNVVPIIRYRLRQPKHILTRRARIIITSKVSSISQHIEIIVIKVRQITRFRAVQRSVGSFKNYIKRFVLRGTNNSSPKFMGENGKWSSVECERI